ncbi:MAG: segregation/condensation protein A [Firmicutes bacterium]|nr:segregation/condensation protein A [Bacillota bacterium]
MNYKVSLEQFEGPLDLLLHLIKESNIDIYDIKIEEITSQYLDYIKKVEELNLNIASEYLVMAAELIEMKSKLLLPKKELDVDTDEEDSRENLINRLIEYQKYKEVTSTFKTLEKDRNEIHTKLPSKLDFEVNVNNLENGMDVNLLLEAFQKFLERKKEEKPLNTTVTKKEISVQERCIKIRDILKKKQKVSFEELFETISIPNVVVTFLSILEMIKKSEINIIQENNFSNITISLRGE